MTDPGRGPLRRLLDLWPVYRQLTGDDPLGRGAAVRSPRSAALRARTGTADHVAGSVCPFCAVGCAQRVYADGNRVVQIEGDPESPVSRGRLCPKGSASLQLVTGAQRQEKVRYRAPYATEWTDLDLGTAMDMIADRVLDARARGWQETDARGNRLRRTTGLAALGGGTSPRCATRSTASRGTRPAGSTPARTTRTTPRRRRRTARSSRSCSPRRG